MNTFRLICNFLLGGAQSDSSRFSGNLQPNLVGYLDALCIWREVR
jgi:hypothetical protein